MVEKQTKNQVKSLRTENGLEFYKDLFDNFCKTEGIVRHRIIRLAPQQSRVAK